MLKIKDNAIQKGYKGYWVNKDEKYIDDFDIDLQEDYEKFDITFLIDNILKEEGFNIDFHNCCMSGYDQVIYYDFDDKYSIELYEIEEDKEYTLSFVLKEITTFKDLWELEYLKNIYEKIIKKIKNGLVEKVDD